jgi:hypothetical protein
LAEVIAQVVFTDPGSRRRTMPARRQRQRFSRSSGRRTTWARFQFPLQLAAAGDYSTVDLLSQFVADGGVTQGVTIGRTHLNLAVNGPNANDESDQFAWGIIRGQGSDVGTNIAGAPAPSTHNYADWMFWDILTCDSDHHYFPGGGNVFRLDLKSQRKIPELDMSMNLVAENLSGAVNLTITVTGSVLLLLP